MSCNEYYLGKRKNSRKKRRKIKILLLFVLTFCLALYINIRIFNLVAVFSHAEIQSNLTNAVNKTIHKQLSENTSKYSNLVNLQKKDDGSIASLEIDHTRLLNARTELVSELLSDINNTETLQVKIPLGNLTGINVFSDKGPVLKVNTILTKAFNAYFENSFKEVGINQSLYQINFTVSYEVDLLIPSKNDKLKIVQTFPVMSTVIVGEVPDAYTEIIRLTDDITE